MFLDLTQSPEFMAALRDAVAKAAADLLRANGVDKGDPENTWLTTKEASAFLRKSPSTFRDWKRVEANKAKLVISLTFGDTEPRYQLAALQKLMRDGAIGLPDEELLGLAVVPNPKLNGKRRAVLGAGGHH